jgi:glutamine synthetase
MSLSVLDAFLDRHPSVRFLRLQWQDLSGLLRGRVVPVEQGRLIAMGKKAMRLPPCSLTLVVENSVLPDGSYIGSDTGFPDWSSLRTRQLLDPLYATVMCRIARNLPTHAHEPREDYCPRHALMTVLNKAAHQFNMEFLVGFEVEFEIFAQSPEGKLVPHSLGLGGGACAGLRDPCYKYVEEAMQVLLEAGVGLEAVHSEGLLGQYEFCLGPRPPMEAVDELILVHDTLKRVLTRHGLVATMFPRPATSRKQSIGQHTHLSISKPELEKSFLAGILRNLPALSALCLPYELSYERLNPGQAGCRVVAWGTEDRRVPIRKIKPGHWELRCVDATANMYLVLAATLSAGLLGCLNQDPLRLEDSVTSAQVRGTPLPHSLEAALDQLEENGENEFRAVERFMESNVIRHYLNIKRLETSKLKEMEIEEARNWLVELF